MIHALVELHWLLSEGCESSLPQAPCLDLFLGLRQDKRQMTGRLVFVCGLCVCLCDLCVSVCGLCVRVCVCGLCVCVCGLCGVCVCVCV